jgi:hypothetical protein
MAMVPESECKMPILIGLLSSAIANVFIDPIVTNDAVIIAFFRKFLRCIYVPLEKLKVHQPAKRCLAVLVRLHHQESCHKN